MSEIALLIEIVEHGFQKQSWHGTNLRGSVRGLTMEQAMWRPAPKRHNIYELVLHAAYWKYVVRRRITGEKRGSFPLKGSNFFAAPKNLTATQWRDAVALLVDQHGLMVETIAAHPTEALRRRKMVYGIAAHDLYHAGQIQLLKRLQSAKT